MNDRLSILESRVDQLTQRVSDIERRISALDRSEIAAPAPASVPLAPETDLGLVFSLVGRTLLALGGAYLLRALTEAGALPQIAGVALAAAYAAGWVFLAARAGAASKSTSAAFHLGSAALVGYPLLWETTARLHLLGPSAGASALVALTIAILAVARRHELEPGAWVGVVGAAVAAGALLFGTRAVPPFAAALVVCGLATLALWDSKGFPPAWVSAAVADLAVVVLTLGAVVQSSGFSIAAVLTVQLTLFLGYVGIFFRRNVVESKAATLFEMAQGGAATLIGLGGAAATAETPASLTAVLLVGLTAAAFCYRSAIRLLSNVGEGRNAVFYSGLALAMVLFATGAVDSAARVGLGRARRPLVRSRGADSSERSQPSRQRLSPRIRGRLRSPEILALGVRGPCDYRLACAFLLESPGRRGGNRGVGPWLPRGRAPGDVDSAPARRRSVRYPPWRQCGRAAPSGAPGGRRRLSTRGAPNGDSRHCGGSSRLPIPPREAGRGALALFGGPRSRRDQARRRGLPARPARRLSSWVSVSTARRSSSHRASRVAPHERPAPNHPVLSAGTRRNPGKSIQNHEFSREVSVEWFLLLLHNRNGFERNSPIRVSPQPLFLEVDDG